MAATVVRNVFVYGSLLAPEVLTALLHRVPPASLAVVHDYHRFSIKNRIYPAVLPSKGDKVFGKVLFDLSDQELHILDEFEDIEYTRLIVSPRILNTLGADGEPVVGTQVGDAQELIGSRCLEKVGTSQADTVEIGDDAVEISPGHAAGLGLTTEVTAYMYIWADQGDPDLVGDWEYEVWRANHLKLFLAKYVGFSNISNSIDAAP
ncbi:AIG2-like protein D isoform X3 [Physcomitrium patens]|uniref:Putative gamma-glutamylcyclotransferase n=1 Tax=Physcomitrium patens TaxID=3218 RepID=A0A2K1II29_PHYPA|nr:AIG2-like protein D isoform X3 [Physcomitrium patens]PNR28931.1 hypothetical protein PHYPA_027623 [Physcomitrium patens]|eukprot:XP_024363003.1 AIG2-like protein D isoform X3 [Physcomitrella patens]